jgi:predicted RNase H-like HicB family nuclease
MTKRIIHAVIERASDGGYGIYCPDLEDLALFGYGLTEEEAKENLKENLDEHIEFYAEQNKPMPSSLNNGEVEFDYSYDFSGFFKAYPMFNITELAKYLNINSSLLRRYKQGLAFASNEQRKKIENGLRVLSQKLGTVRF